MAYRLMADPLCGGLAAFGGHRDRAVLGRRAPVAAATAIVLIGVGCLAACGANARSASSSQPPSAPETGPTRPSIGAALPSPAIAGRLTGVSTGPGGTAWAVGAICPSACGTVSETHRTLILQWTGGAWSQVPSPTPGGDAVLFGTNVGPGGSAWAVGFSCVSACDPAAETDRTLTFVKGHRDFPVGGQLISLRVDRLCPCRRSADLLVVRSAVSLPSLRWPRRAR